LDKDENFNYLGFPLSNNFYQKKFQIIASFNLEFSSNIHLIHFCSMGLPVHVVALWKYIFCRRQFLPAGNFDTLTLFKSVNKNSGFGA